MKDITDEILMAYIDGQLPREERRMISDLLEHDASVRARIKPYLETAGLREAFNETLQVPASLRDAVEKMMAAAPARRVPQTRATVRRAASWQEFSPVAWLAEQLSMPQWAVGAVPALAVGLLCGAAAVWFSSIPNEGAHDSTAMIAAPSLQLALETQASGRVEDGGAVVPTGTFRSQQDTLCRTYQLAASPTRHYQGAACLEGDGRWHIKVQVEVPAPKAASPRSYTTAGDGHSPAVEQVVDTLIKGRLLNRQDEMEKLRKVQHTPR